MTAEHALPDEYGISLSDAMSHLRSELQESVEAGERERVRFSVDSITLELEVVAKATRDLNGKVTLWKVLTAGGGRKRENSGTHRITLNIRPLDTSLPSGQETLIGDDL
ncbi:trypco2 family protein [Streptomyces sp. NPDC054802]